MLLILEFGLSLLWLTPMIVIWLTLVIIGSFHIRWNFFLKSHHHNYDTDENVVAITFDDGPHPEFTPRILKLLERYHAKATFFCIGKNVNRNSQLIRNILDDGHVIGNHSFVHSNNYGFKSVKNVKEDINENQNLINSLFSIKMRFFRPPFGVTNPNIAKAVDDLNLIAFGWSIRTLDTTEKKIENILRDITSNLQRGDVILMHDTGGKNVRLLENLLNFLQKNNMKSVTLEELFKIRAYEN